MKNESEAKKGHNMPSQTQRNKLASNALFLKVLSTQGRKLLITMYSANKSNLRIIQESCYRAQKGKSKTSFIIHKMKQKH